MACILRNDYGLTVGKDGTDCYEQCRSPTVYISAACLGEGQGVGSDGAAGEEVHLEAGGGGQGGEQQGAGQRHASGVLWRGVLWLLWRGVLRWCGSSCYL